MARAPDPRIEQAKAMYLEGQKLVEIASQLNLPEGTVRRWKSTHKWDSERSDKNNERSDRKKDALKEEKAVVPSEVESVIQNPDLSDKQRLFCIYYIRCFNATKAYQKTYGCDYMTAAQNGSRMLKNAKVKAEIQRLKQDSALILLAELIHEYRAQEGIVEYLILLAIDVRIGIQKLLKPVLRSIRVACSIKTGMRFVETGFQHVEHILIPVHHLITVAVFQ